MKIEIPTGTLDCKEVDSKTTAGESFKSGKFKFIGFRLNDDPKWSLLVIDSKAQAVVDRYRTKMKSREHMDALLEQIIQDRVDKIYRPFGVYCRAWISNKGTLRIPPKKLK